MTLAEAVVLAARLEAVHAWKTPGEPLVFPLPPDEAVPVLSTLLMPGAVYHTDRSDVSDGGTLFLDLGARENVDKVRLAANVLSVATLALGGGGVFYTDLSGGVESRELCLLLRLDDAGTRIELGLRKNGGKVRALPKGLRGDLRKAFAEMPSALRTYLQRLTLFGPWAQGKPLFMVTRAAVERRLTGLGLPADRFMKRLGV